MLYVLINIHQVLLAEDIRWEMEQIYGILGYVLGVNRVIFCWFNYRPDSQTTATITYPITINSVRCCAKNLNHNSSAGATRRTVSCFNITSNSLQTFCYANLEQFLIVGF